MAEKGRLRHLEKIAKTFTDLTMAHKGEVKVTVTTVIVSSLSHGCPRCLMMFMMENRLFLSELNTKVEIMDSFSQSEVISSQL